MRLPVLSGGCNLPRLFEKMDKPHYCLWWIPAGHPTVSEGCERLERYQQHGPTPYSFWFSKLFPAPVQEVAHA